MVQAPLAQTPSADRHLRWLVDRLCQRIFEQADTASAVLLTGSLARGEGTVLWLEDRPLVLSDLDLAVVFDKPGMRDRFAPELNKIAREMGDRLRGEGLLGAIDIGSYAISDLAHQVARPGTLEFRQSARVMHGDPTLLLHLPDYSPSDISTDEVLFLCENRLLELLWTYESIETGGRAGYLALYAGGKAVLDGALAWLLSRGVLPVTTQGRLEAFEERRPADLGAGEEIHLEALRFWSRFKTYPAMESLEGRFGAGLTVEEMARCAWREGATTLLAIYRTLIEEELAAKPGNGTAWVAAAKRARLRHRWRRWMEAWQEREKRGLDWADWGSILSRAPNGTPEHLLGASAAALVACAPGMNGSAGDREAASKIASLINPVGWGTETSWDERRALLVRAWDRWVMRGTRTDEDAAHWPAH